MKHLNYNHLYYFWAVSQHGSISKAANYLGLTPQTITGQIKILEDRFGGSLLRRKGKGVDSTELG